MSEGPFTRALGYPTKAIERRVHHLARKFVYEQPDSVEAVMLTPDMLTPEELEELAGFANALAMRRRQERNALRARIEKFMEDHAEVFRRLADS